MLPFNTQHLQLTQKIEPNKQTKLEFQEKYDGTKALRKYKKALSKKKILVFFYLQLDGFL